MLLTRIAKRFQGLDKLVPIGMRLPLRFRIQSALGALEPEVRLLGELLAGDRGRVALDVGANLGIYTYALHQIGMVVHAFEPQPSCCAVVKAWATDKAGISVHNKGAGSSPGELLLHIPIIDGAPVPTRASFRELEGETVELHVPVVDLDSVPVADVAFIKIDVEGFELQVLQGARRLLEKYRPLLLVEIDRKRYDQASFGSIIGLLRELGYRAHAYDELTLVDYSCNPWAAPERLYNFIFVASAQSGT